MIPIAYWLIDRAHPRKSLSMMDVPQHYELLRRLETYQQSSSIGNNLNWMWKSLVLPFLNSDMKLCFYHNSIWSIPFDYQSPWRNRILDNEFPEDFPSGNWQIDQYDHEIHSSSIYKKKTKQKTDSFFIIRCTKIGKIIDQKKEREKTKPNND